MNSSDNSTKTKKSITLQDLECQEDLGLSGGGNVARIEGAGGVKGYEGRVGNSRNEQRVYTP